MASAAEVTIAFGAQRHDLRNSADEYWSCRTQIRPLTIFVDAVPGLRRPLRTGSAMSSWR